MLYFLIRPFIKNSTFINEFDKSAIDIVIYGGIIWGVLWLIGILVFYQQLQDTTEKAYYLNRWFGKNSYGIWLQPLFWITLTQLLRIRLVRRFLVFRVIIALLFVLTFERTVVLITTLHRDYLPGNWSLNLSIGEIALGLVTKIMLFTFVVTIFHFSKKKLKGFHRQNPEKS